MSWSKITGKGRKPLGWWYHKLMCEYWYWRYTNHDLYDYKAVRYVGRYHKHLNIMCDKYRLTLYAEQV